LLVPAAADTISETCVPAEGEMKRALILLGFLLLTAGVAADQDEPPPPVQDLPRPDFAMLERLPVVAVVDGDTIKVLRDGEKVTVRLIGVDTPETVHPSKEVEWYGKEASRFLANLLKGEEVWLRRDPAAKVDRYGRELAYVYRVPDGLTVNVEIIRQGYGHAYTAFPHPDMEAYRAAEKRARIIGKGLWGPGAGPECAKPTGAETAQPGREPGTPAADATVVYVTREGESYHREGCRYLRGGRMPITLEEARRRYKPCVVCIPPK
jgi:micrococcal nuclease